MGAAYQRAVDAAEHRRAHEDRASEIRRRVHVDHADLIQPLARTEPRAFDDERDRGQDLRESDAGGGMATAASTNIHLRAALLALTTLAGFGCARRDSPPDAPTTEAQPDPASSVETPPLREVHQASASPAPPPTGSTDDQLTWNIRADAAGGRLSQAPGATPGTCVLTYFSERIGAEAWHSTNCIAQKSDAIFMAADGRSVLVLHPELDRLAWQVADLAEVTRAGEPLLKVRAESVISRDSELRIVGQKVHWMQGAAGEPGPSPGLSTRGDAVVFTRIDGTEMAMDFEGRVTRVESVERTRPSAPAAAAQTSPQASSLDGQSTLRSPNPLYAPSSAANVGPARGGPATLPHMYGVNERDRVAAQAAACERDRAFCIDTATNGKLDETQYKLHDDRSQGVVTHSTDSSGNRIPMQNLVR